MQNRHLKRSLYFAAGMMLLALAFIGAFLPVMPSTIFAIGAAACFARSSPKFEAWLLEHRQFGPSLTAWRRHGAILPRAKAMAMAGMALGFGLFYATAAPDPWVAAGVAAFFIASAVFVLTRPSGPGRN